MLIMGGEFFLPSRLHYAVSELGEQIHTFSLLCIQIKIQYKERHCMLVAREQLLCSH